MSAWARPLCRVLVLVALCSVGSAIVHTVIAGFSFDHVGGHAVRGAGVGVAVAVMAWVIGPRDDDPPAGERPPEYAYGPPREPPARDHIA